MRVKEYAKVWNLITWVILSNFQSRIRWCSRNLSKCINIFDIKKLMSSFRMIRLSICGHLKGNTISCLDCIFIWIIIALKHLHYMIVEELCYLSIISNVSDVIKQGETFGAPGWMADSHIAVRVHIQTCPRIFVMSVLTHGVGVALSFSGARSARCCPIYPHTLAPLYALEDPDTIPCHPMTSQNWARCPLGVWRNSSKAFFLPFSHFCCEIGIVWVV